MRFRLILLILLVLTLVVSPHYFKQTVNQFLEYRNSDDWIYNEENRRFFAPYREKSILIEQIFSAENFEKGIQVFVIGKLSYREDSLSQNEIQALADRIKKETQSTFPLKIIAETRFISKPSIKKIVYDETE